VKEFHRLEDSRASPRSATNSSPNSPRPSVVEGPAAAVVASNSGTFGKPRGASAFLARSRSTNQKIKKKNTLILAQLRCPIRASGLAAAASSHLPMSRHSAASGNVMLRPTCSFSTVTVAIPDFARPTATRGCGTSTAEPRRAGEGNSDSDYVARTMLLPNAHATHLVVRRPRPTFSAASLTPPRVCGIVLACWPTSVHPATCELDGIRSFLVAVCLSVCDGETQNAVQRDVCGCGMPARCASIPYTRQLAKLRAIDHLSLVLVLVY
jgi:hypothetical protein